MSNFHCCVKSTCFDPSNPFANFTAEGPDPEIFIGQFFGGGINQTPNLGWSFTSTGCVGTCLSTLSQQDADLCAQSQQIVCEGTSTGGGGGGGGGGGYKPPVGHTIIYSNIGQHCDIICPDGLTFRFSVAPGQFQAFSQSYADAIAQSVACIQGQSERMCLNDIAKGACVNQFYGDIIETQGGTVPITYQIISGSLPPGFSFTQADVFSVDIEGTCSVPGNYTFTVRATDRFGLFMVKNYTIAVLGVTNTPPDPTQGSPYSFSFAVSGGTAPYTFSITAGSLPTGLTMNSSGTISGTPTGSGSSSFTLQVTDSNSITCDFAEAMTVSATCNCKVTDWILNPGNCRLRITGYADGQIAVCSGAVPSALPAWDGTFSTVAFGPTVYRANVLTSLDGTAWAGGVLFYLPSPDRWDISIAAGNPAQAAWNGTLFGLCPIGVYNRTGQCNPAVNPSPLTLTIEAYTP